MLNNKYIRTIFSVLVDSLFIIFSYIVSIFMFSGGVKISQLALFKSISIFVVVIYLLVFLIFRLYKSLWKQASIHEYISLGSACIVAAGICILLTTLILKNNFPNTVHVLACFFILTLTSVYRLSYRLIGKMQNPFYTSGERQNVLIIGGGYTGKTIITKLKEDKNINYNIIGIIDDDKNKKGFSINGVKILGSRDIITKVCSDNDVKNIFIAISKIESKNRREIINICAKTGCSVKIVPDFNEIIDDNKLMKFRNIEPEDLLGRDPVSLDNKGISSYIENKTIMVTGGGGSIGSELCRQIAIFNPKKLIILDIYENNAYDLQNELKYKYPFLPLEVIIASVRDKERIDDVFEKFKPDVVFHAAAHKHVPLMEDNPCEAIKNNVFGTLNIINASRSNNVKKMVLISTDKAVNPTNVMGASKRLCEMLIQTFAAESDTEFAAVRFGNVLGSNGSVIPLFKKQIERGGPVTVTHKDITRYFMTIPEASQLVIQAAAYARGGEIFVLDMGSPVRIYDLAVDMIRLSGYEPNVDIQIKITGLRPGEKLYEELLMSDKELSNTNHSKIFIEKPVCYKMDEMMNNLEKIDRAAIDDDPQQLRKVLKEIVKTYNPL